MKLLQIADKQTLDKRQQARTYEFLIALTKARRERKPSVSVIWNLETLNAMKTCDFKNNYTFEKSLEDYPQLKIKAERMIMSKKAYERHLQKSS